MALSVDAFVKLATPPDDPIATRVRVQPNETTLIEVQWRTKQTLNVYSATCVVGTNDPGRPSFSLKAMGMIYSRVD